MNEIDLGCINNLEALKQLVSLDGKLVIDAGCGGLTYTKLLTELGARVLAIDPDSAQAELNRAAGPIPGIEFIQSGADRMPTDDNSVDGVFFSYSLHHIDASLYDQVFDEVVRVLKPDGFLFVVEPTDCALNQVMRLFHDEEAEREAAQRGLVELAMPRFEHAKIVTYHNFVQYASFEEYLENFGNRTFNPGYTYDDVNNRKVREAFELHGRPHYRFPSPKKIVLLSTPRRDHVA